MAQPYVYVYKVSVYVCVLACISRCVYGAITPECTRVNIYADGREAISDVSTLTASPHPRPRGAKTLLDVG